MENFNIAKIDDAIYTESDVSKILETIVRRHADEENEKDCDDFIPADETDGAARIKGFLTEFFYEWDTRIGRAENVSLKLPSLTYG